MAATKLPIVIDRSPDERSPPIRQRRRLLPGDRHRPSTVGPDLRTIGWAARTTSPSTGMAAITIAIHPEDPRRWLVLPPRVPRPGGDASSPRRRGIRQFLDIGTGLPTANNTHEVAQRGRARVPDRLRGQRPHRAGPRPRPAHQHARRARPPTSTPTCATPTAILRGGRPDPGFHPAHRAACCWASCTTSPTTTRPTDRRARLLDAAALRQLPGDHAHDQHRHRRLRWTTPYGNGTKPARSPSSSAPHSSSPASSIVWSCWIRVVPTTRWRPDPADPSSQHDVDEFCAVGRKP